jgi:hypothetical protein
VEPSEPDDALRRRHRIAPKRHRLPGQSSGARTAPDG